MGYYYVNFERDIKKMVEEGKLGADVASKTLSLLMDVIAEAYEKCFNMGMEDASENDKHPTFIDEYYEEECPEEDEAWVLEEW